MIYPRLRSIARNLWRCREGVAAVEFALVLPFLLLFYLAGYEATQAASTYRKVTDTTAEIANIVSQYAAMSSSDVTGVFSASAQIMAPRRTSPLSIVLSAVSTDAKNKATVAWSRSYNGASALAVGSLVTMPAGLSVANTSYILVQTTYLYTPTIGPEFVKPIPMHSAIFMLPRRSTTITFTG